MFGVGLRFCLAFDDGAGEAAPAAADPLWVVDGDGAAETAAPPPCIGDRPAAAADIAAAAAAADIVAAALAGVRFVLRLGGARVVAEDGARVVVGVAVRNDDALLPRKRRTHVNTHSWGCKAAGRLAGESPRC